MNQQDAEKGPQLRSRSLVPLNGQNSTPQGTRFLRPRWLAILSILVGLDVMGALVSCGTVGPPVAPQDIGVNKKREQDKIAKEKEQVEKEASQRKEDDEKEKPLQSRPGGPIPVEQTLDETPPINPGIRPDSGIMVRPR